MSLTNSPKTGLLVNGDVGDEHYQSLMRQWRGFDALIQPTCKAMQASPPVSPANGDIYVVTTGSGAWSGHDEAFARYNAAATIWEFVAPKEGWEVYDEGTETKYRYSGTAWEAAGEGGGESSLPTGGTTGQVLAKASDTNFDVEWADGGGGGGGVPNGGLIGQVLAKSSNTDQDLTWATRLGAPAGGTTGQVLAKYGDADGEYDWVEPSSSSGPQPIIDVTGTSRTLADADAGSYIRFTNSGTKTCTVANGLAEGEFVLRNAGEGALTISPGTNIVHLPYGGTLVLLEGMTATLKNVGFDEYDLIGQTEPA